jgi:hypothetical protein
MKRIENLIGRAMRIAETGISLAKDGEDYETAVALEVQYIDLQKEIAQWVEAAPQMLDALLRLTHPMAGDDDLEFALATIEKARKENQ